MHEEELVGHAALFLARGVRRKSNLRNSGNGEGRWALFSRRFRSEFVPHRRPFRRPS